MSKHPLPTGLEHSMGGSMLPDLQASFQLFAAHRRKVNAQWSFPEHSHSLFEINMVLDGTQHMQVEGKSFIQAPGDILWILPGIKHASLGASDGRTMEYVCLHFQLDDPSLREQLSLYTSGLYSGGTALEKALRPILDDMAQAAKDDFADNASQRLMTFHFSFRLFAALTELLLHADERRTGPKGLNELASRLAANIENLLTQNHEAGPASLEKFRIEDVAEKLGYSPAYCNRVFQRAYGMSPRQYLSTMKLRKAKLLLMDPELSIEQIAVLLGYNDLSQFSKQFKRWTNMSPSAYRHLSY